MFAALRLDIFRIFLSLLLSGRHRLPPPDEGVCVLPCIQTHTHTRACRVPDTCAHAHTRRHRCRHSHAHAHSELPVPGPAAHLQREVKEQRWAEGNCARGIPGAVLVDGLSQDTGAQQQGTHFRVSSIHSGLSPCSGRGSRGLGSGAGSGELDQRSLSALVEPHQRSSWGGPKGMWIQC